METIGKVDEKILKFFTKISHRFQRLTGRTNYFLAKCAIGVAVSSMMVEIVNYWTPLLASKTRNFDLMLDGAMLAFLFYDKMNADQADERALSHSITKPAMLMVVGPFWRLFFVVLALLAAPFELRALLHTHSIFLEITRDCFTLALCSYFYFMSVDPLPPCAGKVREWILRLAPRIGKAELAPAGNR